MKKILVTGSEGFIGSHVIEELIRHKYKVRAFVLYNSFNSIGWISDIEKKTREKIDIYFGDVRNKDSLKKAFKGIHAVIHLAALIGIPYSYETPQSYLDTNVQGTLNILQTSMETGVNKTIITSTSEVYGSADYVPIDENHKLKPQSPYSASKISADAFAMSFYNAYKLPVTIIRPFNAFGPRQSNRAIIPMIINQILLNKKVIEVGNLYPKRDFTYVKNLAGAYVKILKSRNTNGKIINIGSNFEISIKELIQKIQKIFGTNKPVKQKKERKRLASSEVDRLKASISLAKKIINYHSGKNYKQELNLELTKTVEWYKQNFEYYSDFSDKYIK